VSSIIDQFKTDINARIDKLKTDLSIPPTPPASSLYDDFKYVVNLNPGSMTPNGKWIASYNSNGFTKVDGNGLVMAPGGTELSIYSGSAMVRSTKKFTNFRATLDITNERQTYTKDKDGHTITPPGWQTAWVIFRHLDKWRHWYVVVGLQHMEVGRKDVPTNITDQTEIEKGQMIIWTGGPGTPIGQKRKLTIEFIGQVLKIFLDGTLQVTLVDDGNLVAKGMKLKTCTYDNGEFCPYVEGAQGRYQNVIIESL
jgi:hypothetical protein